MTEAGGTALRVALVCPYSLSRPGGVQGQVLGLARSLVGRGHRVTVFAPVDDAGPTGSVPDGVELVATGHSTSLPANGSVAPVSVSPAAVWRAYRSLQAFAPDVVHVHEPFAPGLPYAILLAGGPAPVVGTFHRSGASTLYRLLSPLTRRMARRLARRCAVSEAAAVTASDALGGSYEVLFNGIEVDRYEGVAPWPTDGPTVFFLGRHEDRKGLGVLLDAWRLVLAQVPTGGWPSGAPVLWVAGDGPATGALSARHPEAEGLHWLGVVDEEEKLRRLAASDVLAAPALGGESFGMVLLEAMAARSVVVASDIDGYRDAAGGCAVLVPPGDPGDLAGALLGVLDGTLAPSGGGAGDRVAWLDAGQARASVWSMASLAERYETAYRSVVVGARP